MGSSTFVDAESDKFTKWWEGHPMSGTGCDNPLYHYTKKEALCGIVESQTWRFSSIEHQKDLKEFKHGLAIALEEFEKVVMAVTGAARPVVREYWSSLQELMAPPILFGRYIACFTDRGDDLNQWRLYGDDGKGFAIGMPADVFKPKVHTKEDAHSKLAREAMWLTSVIYNETTARANMRLVAQNAVATVRRCAARGYAAKQKSRRQLVEQLSIMSATPILWAAMTTKDSDYAIEQEYRLMIINDAKKLAEYVTPRAAPAGPYIASPWGRTQITEVVVGPSAPPEAESEVHALFAKFGHTVSVRRSKKEYRS